VIYLLFALVGLGLIWLTGYVTDRLVSKYQPPPPEASEQDWFFSLFHD
jgi:hypothetical protein